MWNDLLRSNLDTKRLYDLDYLFCYKIPKPPRWLICILLDIRNQIGVNLVWVQLLCETDAGVHRVHFHQVLVVLLNRWEITKEFILWNFWDVWNHLVQRQGCWSSDLWVFRFYLLGVYPEKLFLLQSAHLRKNSWDYQSWALLTRKPLGTCQPLYHSHNIILNFRNFYFFQNLLYRSSRLLPCVSIFNIAKALKRL